jgi:Zn-dependent protease
VAISAAASLQAGVFIFNLLPIPPLDGWHIVSAGSSPSLRAQAASLGFMPILALLILFRSSPELATAYWSLTEGFGAIFGVEWEPSNLGRWMLTFR